MKNEESPFKKGDLVILKPGHRLDPEDEPEIREPFVLTEDAKLHSSGFLGLPIFESFYWTVKWVDRKGRDRWVSSFAYRLANKGDVESLIFIEKAKILGIERKIKGLEVLLGAAAGNP